MVQATTVQIFTDGGARGNPGPAAIGVVAKVGETILHEEARFLGHQTNNEAEYAAFQSSLTWLLSYLAEHATEVMSIVWNLDSMLVVEQLTRRWKIKEPRLQVLAQEIWQNLAKVSCTYQIQYIPRAQNAHADRLVNQALDLAAASK